MDIRKVCPTCGELVNAEDSFCSNCGTKFCDETSSAKVDEEEDSSTQIIDDANQPTVIPEEDTSTQIIEDDASTHILDDDSATMTTDDAVNAEARLSAESAYLPGEDLEPEDDTRIEPEPQDGGKRSVWIWLGPVLAALLLGAGAVYWFGFRTSETLGDRETYEEESDSEDENNVIDDVTVIEERATTEEATTPDLAFSDLHGRVRKSVSTNGTTEFDAMGNMTTNEFLKVKRNGEGYIVAADVDDGEGGTATFEYQLDSRDRYAGFTITFPSGEIRQAKITYSSNGTIDRMIVTNNYDQRLEFEYTDYEFDKHHNWTSRKIKRTAYYNDEYGNQQQNSDEATDVRTISYYE